MRQSASGWAQCLKTHGAVCRGMVQIKAAPTSGAAELGPNSVNRRGGIARVVGALGQRRMRVDGHFCLQQRNAFNAAHFAQIPKR